IAVELFALPRPDLLQRLARPVERLEADEDRRRVEQQAAEAEAGEREIEAAGKVLDVRLEDVAVADDAEARRAALVVEHHFRLADLHLVAEGIDGRVEALVARVEGNAVRVGNGNAAAAERGG